MICEGEVAGIQSYINQVCQQPHMFHLFSGWKSFIDCGVEQKCKEDSCQKVCSTVNKDEHKPVIDAAEISTILPPEDNEASEATTYLIPEVEKSSETTKIEVTSTATTIAKPSTLNIVAENTTIEVTTNEATTTTTSTTEPSTTTTTTTTKTTTTTSSTTTTPTTTTTQSTTITIVTETLEGTIPGAERREIDIVDNSTNPPVTIKRQPDIQHRHHVIKDGDLIRIQTTQPPSPSSSPSGRRAYQYSYNSSSARYMNGLLIIFTTLILTI